MDEAEDEGVLIRKETTSEKRKTIKGRKKKKQTELSFFFKGPKEKKTL